MLNPCVKAVGDTSISLGTSTEFSTHTTVSLYMRWTNPPISAQPVHNLCIQLCTPNLLPLTEMVSHLSPLSTGLIINTIPENKENLISKHGG
jgi:hypothetical protein